MLLFAPRKVRARPHTRRRTTKRQPNGRPQAAAKRGRREVLERVRRCRDPSGGSLPAAVRRREYLVGSVHPARGLDVSQSASPDAVIHRPPPYDASTFAPTGKLSAAERAWTARLYHPHHLALAWRLLGRDADGHLVAGTIVSCGRDTAASSASIGTIASRCTTPAAVNVM